MGFFSKIFNGLKKTKDAIASKISSIFVGELNDEFYEDLEYVLISSDISVSATEEIIADLKTRAKKEKIKTEEDFKALLREVMVNTLDIDEEEEEYPSLITIVGVNGVGKTTAIGKLAHSFKSRKKSVLMVAGDTFRAAASDQLEEWSKRANCRIVRYNEGADPGAVVFDGIKSAVATILDAEKLSITERFPLTLTVISSESFAISTYLYFLFEMRLSHSPFLKSSGVARLSHVTPSTDALTPHAS